MVRLLHRMCFTVAVCDKVTAQNVFLRWQFVVRLPHRMCFYGGSLW